MGLILSIFAGAFCFYAGWVHAHLTVAGECERLGGFYVGKTVYKCVAQEKKEQSK